MRTLQAIQKNQIDLWFAFPNEIKQVDLLTQYRELLTESERQSQQQFFFERHRHQYLISRAMLRSVLSRYAAVEPQQWVFTKNKYGKPAIAKEHGLQQLRFNISHTDKLVVCAVTKDFEVGVDAEYLLRPGETIAVADRFFSPQEVTELMSVEQDSQRSRFFDYWTLKEAYIKACGMGLAIPLNDFSFHLTSGKINITFSAHRHDNPADWKFWLMQPSHSHKVAVGLHCLNAPLDFALQQFKIVPLADFQKVDYPILMQS